ncbi:MAG: hypothetical protein II776_02920, partial [Clostridia bacterium]|nr:hypothetical protein [Clostridia bacterium]
ETDNYFFYYESAFQTFRVISCELYTAGDQIRIRGRATAVSPAESSADKVDARIYYQGQNQTGPALSSRTVTVIEKGVNEGVTVSFDAAAGAWSELAASGHTGFLLFLTTL